MQETRQNRIARLLQKELASIFQSQTRATHGILISVTQTKISPDLSICTAYLSIFPSDKAEELLKNINKNEKPYATTWGNAYAANCVLFLNYVSSWTTR